MTIPFILTAAVLTALYWFLRKPLNAEQIEKALRYRIVEVRCVREGTAYLITGRVAYSSTRVCLKVPHNCDPIIEIEHQLKGINL